MAVDLDGDVRGCTRGVLHDVRQGLLDDAERGDGDAGLSDFEDLEGNLGMLLGMLALGWIVGALLEELAYRGYLQTRMRQLLGNSAAALVVTVLVSSVLFGRVHSEQGLIGIVIVTLDAIVWSVLRYHYKTLWASVLAHGFNDTIGFITFFLVGPVYGLW